MKIRNILCVVCAMLAISLSALADGRIYVYDAEGSYHYGMLNRVSDNGRWAVGADDMYQTGAYMVDTTQPDVLTPIAGGELYDVTDDGMAVGAWYDNQGTATEPINYSHAAIYRDGWTRLPEPAACCGRSYARCVSADGRYIGGMAFCTAKDSEVGGKYYPCLWTLGADGTYTVTVYNNLVLPGNMGFYVNDMTADGRTLVGSVCTDAGGTVPAIVTDGKLLCWNKMEWKEWKFDMGGSTETYYAGFVDGVIEGTDEATWFNGGFNYICGDCVYGHRTVASNVNAEKGSGTLTHYRTIYNLKTGEFADEPGNSMYSCGLDGGHTFVVSGMGSYYKRNGMMRRVNDALNLISNPSSLIPDGEVGAVYGSDADGRVLACSMLWFNEMTGEYNEAPLLVVMERALADGGVDEPSLPTQTESAKPFTLSPSNEEAVAELSGAVKITFPTVGGLRLPSPTTVNSQLPLTLGDKPNELRFIVPAPITETGEYTFTIPEGSLVDDDTNQWLPEVAFTYTVDESLALGWEVSPSLDEPIQQLDGTYTITLTNYSSVTWPSTVIPCRVYIYKASEALSMRALTYFDATVKKNTVTFTAKPGLYEAGSYYINLSGFANAAGDVDLDDIFIPFTLTGGTPPPAEQKPELDQTFMLSPDNHAPLPELSGRIVVSFPGVEQFADIGGFPVITTPSGDERMVRIKSFPQLEDVDYIPNAGYIDLDAAGLRFTEPGIYTISFPKFIFHVDGDFDKDYVDPFEIKYTVGAPWAVLMSENFDGDYRANFPFSLDLDGGEPSSSVGALFLSAETGYYMPWWALRESSASTDRFMGSHSCYSQPAQSDDWFISRPIYIPAEGYSLHFDAQSVVLRNGDRLSDLQVFVSEQLPTSKNRPETPTAVYEQIACGATPDVTTDEWTHFTLPLDEWVGRTVHVSFVNRNTDRDLLCIDNVRVSRSEEIEVTFDELPEYIADNSITLQATVTASGIAIGAYDYEFTAGSFSMKGSGDGLDVGETRTFTAECDIEKGLPTTCTFTLTPKDGNAVSRSFTTTCLLFVPEHRVLIEETTGLWCGNCPIGTYNIESLKEDPAIGDDVLPVSVHIKGTTIDRMVISDYAEYLGLAGVAPMTRIDRGAAAIGFGAAHDAKYDPTDPNSFAHAVHARRDVLSLFDISVEAEPVTEGTDTVAFRCTSRVRPAVRLDATRYRVGFILTENNVGMDNRGDWVQHNYFSGYPFESRLGGWTELPEEVQNLRYHYVARALPNPSGIEGSFTELKADQEYTVSATVIIPDTYLLFKGQVASMAVRPYMCELTAYIVDMHDLSIANSARVAVTEQALDLYTVADMIADGIETERATKAPAGEYDLQGRRVSSRTPGVHIVNGHKLVR